MLKIELKKLSSPDHVGLMFVSFLCLWVSRISYSESCFLRVKNDLTTYSVWLQSLICELICFQIVFFPNGPFGGHYDLYQSEILIRPTLLRYLSEKDV